MALCVAANNKQRRPHRDVSDEDCTPEPQVVVGTATRAVLPRRAAPCGPCQQDSLTGAARDAASAPPTRHATLCAGATAQRGAAREARKARSWL